MSEAVSSSQTILTNRRKKFSIAKSTAVILDFFQACCLCAIPWGALKRTSDRRWAHLLCSLLIYEVNFMDEDRREPINVHNIISERLILVCILQTAITLLIFTDFEKEK
jgi:hypothetical protein